MSKEVPAKLVKNMPEKPGEFCFMRTTTKDGVEIRPSGIAFQCPVGCGVATLINLDVPGNEAKKDKYQWNGDREKPLLAPRLSTGCDCGWSGFLANGFFWELPP